MAPSLLETEHVAPIPEKQQNTIPPAAKDKSHEEYQYLDLIREILETGEHRPDR